MLLRPLLVLMSLSSPFALLSQAAATHAMTLDDAAKLLQVGRPELSPDGQWIAYTLRHTDVDADKNIGNLWMARFDGSQDVQLTYDTEGAAAPRWSPDGRYLAFTSARPGKAKGMQVWLLDQRGGEARQLTDVKQDLGDYRWSPDSKQLLLTLTPKDPSEADDDAAKKAGKPVAPKPVVIDRYHFKQDIEGYLTDRHQHLFLFDIATGKLTRLIVGEADMLEEHDAEWSPDGKLIAFTRRGDLPDPFRTANSDVYVVDATGGSPRKLTTFPGPDEAPLAWSADSAQIAYRQATVPGYSAYNQMQLASVPATGGTPRLLAVKLDRPVSAPLFTQDGKAVLTTVGDDRNSYVERVSLMGAVEQLTAGPGDAAALTSAAGHTALLWSTDNKTSEIYALDPNGLRQVTHHNDALLATLQLPQTQDLTAKTKDGSEVHSLLTMPTGYKTGTKAPMLLFIHGGPTAQDTHTFDLSRQLFAAHGYAVLNVNYRGSNGRGLEYSRTIAADWGNKEVIDLLAAVEGAVATGMVDPNKLAVGGWSYGGILTDYLIATTTRFKAASSGAGVGNLFGLYGIDQYILQYDNELGQPWKHPDVYLKLSYPFFHADRIQTPTLFMGGDKDFNVPVEGGEQMYQALRSIGTPAELILYPGQFHGFTRPSFIRDRYQRWFGWYDKYLGLVPAQH